MTSFYTKIEDEKSSMQNSGITLEVESMDFASSSKTSFLCRIAWKEGPFIMDYQTKQVFYVKDPSNERLSVVVQGRTEHDVHPHDDSRVQSVRIYGLKREGGELFKEDFRKLLSLE